VSTLEPDGSSLEREILVQNKAALQQRLSELQQVVLQVRKVSSNGERIAVESVILWCEHLRMLLDAGLSMHESLCALAEENENRALSILCQRCTERISAGQSLSHSLSSYRIDRFVLAMVRTGEETGKLGEMLGKVSEHLRWRTQLMGGLRSALSYPAMILLVLMGLIPMLFLYLVPQLLVFLGNVNDALPWYTRALIDVQGWVASYGLVVVSGVLAIMLIIGILWIRVERFGLLFDRLLMQLPIVGSLLLQLRVSQISEQLGVMYGAGLALVDAVEMIAESLDNRYLRRQLSTVSERLRSGNNLHSALAETGFPAMFVRMTKVGELSGGLDAALAQASMFYSHQAHRRAQTITAWVGPLSLLFVGLLIIWIVAAFSDACNGARS